MLTKSAKSINISLKRAPGTSYPCTWQGSWHSRTAAEATPRTKRKSGLWKKAAELAILCRASLAVVVFSEAGKAFAFGSPTTDAVLGCADVDGGALAPVPAADDVKWEALEALCRETEAMGVEVAAEAQRMNAVGKKVVEVQAQAGKRFWWEADVEALGEAELPVFARALQRLRDNVRRHADKMPPRSSSFPTRYASPRAAPPAATSPWAAASPPCTSRRRGSRGSAAGRRPCPRSSGSTSSPTVFSPA
ncbi:agamous-like MADS-box protein AGL62-like [Hordeum vulgare]|nr:agamous-like MADS-box protein AGL62-like [Hordeum vulgare]